MKRSTSSDYLSKISFLSAIDYPALWLTFYFPSGGYRANQYAANYPERVGNFVLDAPGPHNAVSLAVACVF